MKLTSQGVRDLNGPNMNGQQTNQRRRKGGAPCWHDWEHDSDCSGCDIEYDSAGRGHAVHYERCRGCGASRRA